MTTVVGGDASARSRPAATPMVRPRPPPGRVLGAPVWVTEGSPRSREWPGGPTPGSDRMHVRSLASTALGVALALTMTATAAAGSGSARHGGGDHGHGHAGQPRHIVVIYEENHSFDNLYGGWEGVQGRAAADPAHTTQVDQAGRPYKCLLQDDVNLTSPPLGTAGSAGPPNNAFASQFPNAPFTIDDFIKPTDT